MAPSDPEAIVPVLIKARKRGIKVITWDADASSTGFFVQSMYCRVCRQSTDGYHGRRAGKEAKYLMITGSLTAANQNLWMDEMTKYGRSAYPQMVNLSATPKVSQEDQAMATQVAVDSLKPLLR
ncbi:MAG: substrate-binding domain-containing protein [Terriglobia bacterium]